MLFLAMCCVTNKILDLFSVGNHYVDLYELSCRCRMHKASRLSCTRGAPARPALDRRARALGHTPRLATALWFRWNLSPGNNTPAPGQRLAQPKGETLSCTAPRPICQTARHSKMIPVIPVTQALCRPGKTYLHLCLVFAAKQVDLTVQTEKRVCVVFIVKQFPRWVEKDSIEEKLHSPWIFLSPGVDDDGRGGYSTFQAHIGTTARRELSPVFSISLSANVHLQKVYCVNWINQWGITALS